MNKKFIFGLGLFLLVISLVTRFIPAVYYGYCEMDYSYWNLFGGISSVKNLCKLAIVRPVRLHFWLTDLTLLYWIFLVFILKKKR